MDAMSLKALMHNEYVWILLAFCTSASLIFGIYSWIRGKRRKEIQYISSVYRIIRDGEGVIPELDITYGDKAIQNLFITKYVIWNSGTEVINKKDMVNTVSLKIVSQNENTAVLNAQILFQNENTNGFCIVKIESNSIEVEFDYMDSREGCVIQIMHTGKSENLEINAKIKGGKLKRKKNGTDQKIFEKENWKKIFIQMIGMLGIMAICISLYLNSILNKILVEKNVDTFNINVTVFLCFFTVIWGTWLWKFTRGVCFYNIPSAFRKAIEYDQTDFEF